MTREEILNLVNSKPKTGGPRGTWTAAEPFNADNLLLDGSDNESSEVYLYKPSSELKEFIRNCDGEFVAWAGEDSLFHLIGYPVGTAVLHEPNDVEQFKSNDKVKIYVVGQCDRCSNLSFLIISGEATTKFLNDYAILDKEVGENIFRRGGDHSAIDEIKSYLSDEYGFEFKPGDGF